MGPINIVVTAAIYAAVLLDAVLIGVLVTQVNKTPGKAVKFAGERSKVCRAVCLGCVLSLTIAGVLVWRDFWGLSLFWRDGVESASAAGLIVLLAFNLAINAVMILVTLNERISWFSSSRLSAAADLESGNLVHRAGGKKEAALSPLTVKLLPSQPTGPKRLITAADMLFSRSGSNSKICITADGSGQPTNAIEALLKAAVAHEFLDRVDSDDLMRMGPIRVHAKKAAVAPVQRCCPFDEDILDALMHDTVRTLVEV